MEEAADLLRNALAASTLNEDDDSSHELGVLVVLHEVLLFSFFMTLEPTVE